MNIPSKVKIGGVTYEVIKTNRPDYSEKVVDGNINYSNGTIRISEGFGECRDYQEYILVHEIVHGIFDLMNITKDEEIVTKIGKGLYAVIKDNPGLFETENNQKSYEQCKDWT